jgi:hypothetical protein
LDIGNAVAVDGAGNVYTTGGFTGTVNFNPNGGKAQTLSGGGIFVSKLDASGNFVAAASMAGSADGSGQGMARGIMLDGAGNVYTTGFFTGTADFDPSGGTYNLTSNGGNDVFVSKLTQTGQQFAATSSPAAAVLPAASSGGQAAGPTAGARPPAPAAGPRAGDELPHWLAGGPRQRRSLFADWLALTDVAPASTL